MNSRFAHLHVHTEFSILDGAARAAELVDAAAAAGQTALGITDHGNMYGLLARFCQIGRASCRARV